MSEKEKTRPPIDDLVVAWDVAYSAKDDRSIAAGARVIDVIVKKAKGSGEADTEAHQETVAKIIGAYAVYPEVFKAVFPYLRKGVELDLEGRTKAAFEILSNGSIPMYRISGDERLLDAAHYDKSATVVEDATEALLVHPPSQDFLNEFNLGRQHYRDHRSTTYTRDVTVADIIALFYAAQHHEQQLTWINHESQREIERYNKLEFGDSKTDTKLTKIQSMLARVPSYIPHPYTTGYDKVFKDLVRTAESSEETTIGDLKKLYETSIAKVLELTEEVRDHSKATYNAIISGEAASYVAPGVEDTETQA